jgi:hypothetical protein
VQCLHCIVLLFGQLGWPCQVGNLLLGFTEGSATALAILADAFRF